jgi:hypothetical protein
MSACIESVQEITRRAKVKLFEPGVPDENVPKEAQVRKRAVARDILQELEDNGYGIVAIGRKGARAPGQFRPRSNASELLHGDRVLVVCSVH